jgi:hypothetical protein
MDPLQTVGTVGGIIAIIAGMIASVWAALNHHRIKSKCCGCPEATLEVVSIEKDKAVGFQAAATNPTPDEKPTVST